MIYEKIIKDERGKMRIEVKLHIDTWHNNSFKYSCRVWHTAPKKRTEYLNRDILTDAELNTAMEEFWQTIKPNVNETIF